MSVKTAGVGHFQIPTAPAAGVSVASGAANVYTTTPVQLIAATAAALYITGIYAEEAAVSAATYKSVQLMIGAAAAETVAGQYLIAPSTGSTVTRTYRPIFPPIPVANGIRISAKTADSVGALATLISLEVIAQTNVVDDGIAITTVTTVTSQLTAAAVATGVWTDTTAGDFTTALSVGKSVMNGVALGTGLTVNTVTNQLTAAAIATGVWQDATAGDFTTASSIGKALYIANVAPGAAGGHFIAGTNAATTITTGLTTTFTGSLTGSVASVTGAVGSVTGLTASNLDATISSRMATYTQPTGFLAATFPAGTVANTTNITAGTITTATNLTNAPTAGDFTAVMKTSIGTAVAASAVASVTGNVGGNVAGTVGSVVGAVGSVTGLTASNLDTTVSSRLATAGYTAPDNTSIAAVKVQTDKLTFTVPNKLDVNVLVVNGVTAIGTGAVGDRWRALGT